MFEDIKPGDKVKVVGVPENSWFLHYGGQLGQIYTISQIYPSDSHKDFAVASFSDHPMSGLQFIVKFEKEIMRESEVRWTSWRNGDKISDGELLQMLDEVMNAVKSLSYDRKRFQLVIESLNKDLYELTTIAVNRGICPNTSS